MIISRKEKRLLAVTVVFMLYAWIGLTLRKRIEDIRARREIQRDQAALVESYKSVIAQRDVWDSAYAGMANLMPVFPLDRQVETYWLGVLDRIASKNNLRVIRRQAEAERAVGDVFEMPIDCKEWEGDLESLVAFLYDIHAEGAMLDVRRLFVRSNNGKGAPLRGSFTLYCAYMRSEDAPPTPHRGNAEADAGEDDDGADDGEPDADGSDDGADAEKEGSGTDGADAAEKS